MTTFTKKSALAIAGVVAGATVAGGIAGANIPSASDGAVTACVNAEGAPRIIDIEADQACNEGENQVSWGPGWKARGQYAGGRSYEPGDVVSMVPAPAVCGRGDAAWFGGAYVKVKAGAELPGHGDQLCKDPNWVRLFSFPEPARVGSVRVGANDNDAFRTEGTSTRFSVRTWSYDGVTWLYVKDRYLDLDFRNCAVTALPVTDVRGATVTRVPADYKDWILLYKNVGTTRSNFPLDVTISCL